MNVLIKKIDLYGQLAMLLIPALFGIWGNGINAFAAYFSVGAWQVISTLLHLTFQKNKCTYKARNAYNYTLLTVALLGGLCLIISDLFFVYLYLMLIVGLVMAIWYFLITLNELQAWQHKAWVHLK